MNILVFSWRGPGHPNAGGAEMVTHEHSKAWVQAGHAVTLFTSYYQGAKKEQKLDGVNIIRRGQQVLGVQLEAFKWYLFENNQKCDLVIDEFHGIPFFTPLYIRTKKLAFIHEVTKEVWKLNQWFFPLSLFISLVGSLIEPYIFKLYKRIPFMTVSESTKADLIEWGIQVKNITVIHNGIIVPPMNKIFKKENKPTLIFLGALSKDKGIEDALEIFSIVHSQYRNYQFWVVGKGDPRYVQKLKSKSEQLGLNNKVKFLGFVTENKKFELLAKAHLLVNTSVREGWGLVVIEAAAMATPTVGYDVPGLRDSIDDGKTGILCKPNTQDCAEKILQLIKNRQLYETLTQNCLRWSRRFSWDKSVNESLRLIDRLVTR